MGITIKSEREIELMREAGKILSKVHDILAKEVKPGVSTYHIDKIGKEAIYDFGCKPSFLGYDGYPASICVSVNDEVIHGIPSKNRIIKDGDIVSIDVGACYRGYHGDSCCTFACGNVSEKAKRLMEATEKAFYLGAAQAVAGNRLGDIGSAIQETVWSVSTSVTAWDTNFTKIRRCRISAGQDTA